MNASTVHSDPDTHKSHKKSDDKFTIETLFNSGMRVQLENATYDPIVLDFFADDYKYNNCQEAIGNNCSIDFDEEANTIITNHLPTFVQKRLLTNDKLAVSFKSLIDDPVLTLREIHGKMLKEHAAWEKQRDKKKADLSAVALQHMQDEIDEFEREIKRFEFGIEIINDYPMVQKSFINMNRTFMATSKKYSTWRLFQIVFIVSLVPDIAACDEELLLDEQKAKTTLNDVSLLYFPTGGGKTEAFLGVLIFNVFFDRYRGKDCGVTSILRYPFTSTSKCLVDREFCDVEASNFEEVEMYDPAPTLFIQDELHLIRESLGTYASHYESFVDYFIKNVSPSKRPAKVIGATATISSYETQITQLYSKDPIRFPCASPDLKRNFYSYIEDEDTQRLILGYAPYGKAIINSVVYSLKYMREVVFEYFKDPNRILAIPGVGINSIEEAIEILKDYWIFLEYNNVKRDGNNVEGALDTPINVELRKANITPFETRKMTGDETFQDVREVLSQVENNDDVYNGINLIVATSMISHGVDADRFNIMFFYGVPGNTAEYIQAYSRTGRRYSSIVIDIIRPSRETDQSYLKNFVKFHEYKDIMVESVPINRWATKAIDCTLPGIFMGLLLDKYDPELQFSVGPLFFMKNMKKAMSSSHLDATTVKNELMAAYGCTISGQVNELGNQYKQKIEQFVDDIFEKVVDRNWENENIFTGFQLMGYHIMNSLRDTDTQLIIELE